MWTYKQSSGEFFDAHGERIGVGYAGFGEGKNNPALQQVHDIGPLPRGQYHIGPAYLHPHLGPVTMNLTPQAGTPVFGRASFRIHGDAVHAPGTASHGCIVQGRDVRVQVDQSLDKDLDVIA